MDQVDNIIFQNFVSIGWEKDEVNSLQDLEVSEVSKLMVKCLSAINPECNLPELLPHNMSQRFRAAAKIAESIKDLGYNGDLGYHSILYSNEADLRKIFTFLIEKLPKDAPTLSKTPSGKLFSIEREACRKITEVLQRPWMPPHCANVARRYKGISLKDRDGDALTQYGTLHSVSFQSSWRHCLLVGSPSFTEPLKAKGKSDSCLDIFDLPSKQILPTLLNSHSELVGRCLSSFNEDEHLILEPTNDLHKGNNKFEFNSIYKAKEKTRSDLTDIFEIPKTESPAHNHFLEGETLTKYSSSSNEGAVIPSVIEPKETDVEKMLKEKGNVAEKKISSLSSEISELQEEVAKVIQTCKEKEASVLSLQHSIEEREGEIAREEKKLALIQKTSSLATDPLASIERLQNSLEASKEKDAKLMKQWLTFKEPLEEDLKAATLKLEKKRSAQIETQKDISELKKTTVSLIEEAKKKEVLLIQLNDQKAKMTKGVNRAVYTKQILDISAKVRKQKQEIEKILSDTRVIQKEINNLTGKLQRTFAVVEDASFKAASANEHARPMYRSVISIHEEFGALVDTIRVTGSVQREIADLQQQLNSEKSKNIEDNVKRLQEDFSKLKTENAALKQTLKTKS